MEKLARPVDHGAFAGMRLSTEKWSYPQRGVSYPRIKDHGPGIFAPPSRLISSEMVLLCALVKNGVGNVIGERTKLDKASEHFISITVLFVA